MNPASKRALAVVRIAIGVGLLLYVVSATGGWLLISRLGRSPWVLAFLLAGALLGAAIEAIRLRLLYRAQRFRISFTRSFQLVAIGTLYNFVIPGGTGGDVMKMYYMARENRGRMIEAGMVLVVDRAVALFGLLLLILALAGLNVDLMQEHVAVRWLVIAAAVAAVGVFCVMKVSFSRRVRGSRLVTTVTRSRRLGGLLGRVLDALHSFRDHRRSLLLALGLSLCGHLLLAAMLLAAGIQVFPDAAAQILPFLSLLGLLANVIPLTPGGMGVGEAATEQLYRLVGCSGGAALILAWRLSSLPLCGLGGLFSIAGVKRRGLPPNPGDDQPPAALSA